MHGFHVWFKYTTTGQVWIATYLQQTKDLSFIIINHIIISMRLLLFYPRFITVLMHQHGFEDGDWAVSDLVPIFEVTILKTKRSQFDWARMQQCWSHRNYQPHVFVVRWYHSSSDLWAPFQENESHGYNSAKHVSHAPFWPCAAPKQCVASGVWCLYPCTLLQTHCSFLKTL